MDDCPLRDEVEDLKSRLAKAQSALYHTGDDRGSKGDTLDKLVRALREMIRDLWANRQDVNAMRLENILRDAGLPLHVVTFFSVERKTLTPEKLRTWWIENHSIGAKGT